MKGPMIRKNQRTTMKHFWPSFRHSSEKQYGKCRTRLAKLAALSCIVPDIVTAIVEGRQPPSLDARALLAAELPLDWHGQRVTLGFEQA